MNEINIELLKNLLDEASHCMHSSENLLQEMLETPIEEESSMEDTVFSIKLVLQYRLGSQDALSALLSIDQNLLYLLGIQPRHSRTMNLDRLAYALGEEDLKQVLHALSLLVNSLLKITHRYHQNHLSFVVSHQKKTLKPHPLVKGLQKLVSQQNHFLSLIQKFAENITLLLEYQSVGPVLDHIAALRGPISQFYQAIVHGLGEAKLLYERINKKDLLEQKLEFLLKQTEEVLHARPSLYRPHPPSPALTPLRKLSAEQLEQRASAKRLRPFF
ncbi:hypothetical protein [Fluoribacter dumoffii]|uniref:Uncharacterized protein n=1 Tax=Fluoribacter dumoffii TaxID=463 RepID=A0A377GC78_9GAMM|nr:hypothetical protein [Fluoribacter dumoffii]KTC90633.1 hypothetical protein Ldum_1701 [Fluoribacter dumoffii NY 23]STO22314.1 Uncharacterised protein [Fluoribacter dumoffii]